MSFQQSTGQLLSDTLRFIEIERLSLDEYRLADKFETYNEFCDRLGIAGKEKLADVLDGYEK